MAATLAFSMVGAMVASALFAYVGYRLGKRVVTTPEGKAAFTCFRIWWYGIALTTAVAALRTGLYMAGQLQPWMYVATSQFTVVVVCISLWALLCNLLYLYTGSLRAWPALAGLYLAVMALFVSLVSWMGRPLSIGDDGWSLVPVTQRILPAWGLVIALLVLIGPQLAAALAYLRLLRHAPNRTTRYRIRMVAGSLILWFGSAIIASILQLGGAAGELVTRLAGILAALLVLFAYDPPEPVRRRLGVKRAGEEHLPVEASPPAST